jgi:hypothetical protein
VVVRAPNFRVIEVAMVPAPFHVVGSVFTRVTVIPGRGRRALLSWRHGAGANHIGRQSVAPRD